MARNTGTLLTGSMTTIRVTKLLTRKKVSTGTRIQLHRTSSQEDGLGDDHDTYLLTVQVHRDVRSTDISCSGVPSRSEGRPDPGRGTSRRFHLEQIAHVG
jgi:hypothetical protein